MPLVSRQQWPSRPLWIAALFTDLTLMNQNLIWVPLPVWDSSKTLLQLITADYSLLFEYFLSCFIWKHSIFKLLPFIQNFPYIYTLLLLVEALWWLLLLENYVTAPASNEKGILLLALSFKRWKKKMFQWIPARTNETKN